MTCPFSEIAESCTWDARVMAVACATAQPLSTDFDTHRRAISACREVAAALRAIARLNGREHNFYEARFEAIWRAASQPPEGAPFLRIGVDRHPADVLRSMALAYLEDSSGANGVQLWQSDDEGGNDVCLGVFLDGAEARHRAHEAGTGAYYAFTVAGGEMVLGTDERFYV